MDKPSLPPQGEGHLKGQGNAAGVNTEDVLYALVMFCN